MRTLPKLHLLMSVFACVLACGFFVPNIFADSIGGVDFGSAGMAEWSVLGVGGAGSGAGWKFGTVATPIAFAGGCGPALGNGCGGPTSNVGIAGAGTFSTDAQSLGICGGCTPFSGKIFLTSTATSSGVPASLAAQVIKPSSLPLTAALDANMAVTTALSLSSNVTVTGNLINTNGPLTINPTNPGGQNVVHLTSIQLGNHANVTFGGPAGTTWVVVVSGNLTINGPATLQGPGGSTNPSKLLLIVEGDTSTSGGSNSLSVIDAGLVELTGKIDFSPGEINGEVITGGSHAQFVSGTGIVTPTTTTPEPSSLVLLGMGLLGVGRVIRRKTNRLV